jgi:hypothetical protein
MFFKLQNPCWLYKGKTNYIPAILQASVPVKITSAAISVSSPCQKPSTNEST